MEHQAAVDAWPIFMALQESALGHLVMTALLSLVLWLGVITLGRLIAYYWGALWRRWPHASLMSEGEGAGMRRMRIARASPASSVEARR